MSDSVQYISGIGDGADIQLLDIHPYTPRDMVLLPTGVLGGVVLNPNSLIKSDLDTWLPEIQHGYMYDQDEELYLYADKATEIWSIRSILESSGFINSYNENWEIIPYINSSGYYQNREFNPSGHFSFVLSGQPKPESPIIVTKLPYDLSINTSVDPSLPSGYLSDYTTSSGFMDITESRYIYDPITGSGNLIYSSGIQSISSDYIRYGEFDKYIITENIINDDLIPLYSKQTQIAKTGFLENSEYDYINNSGYVYVPALNAYCQKMPVVSLTAGYEYPEFYDFAEYITSENRLIIPGEICNVMVEYEACETSYLKVSDLDMNPISTISDYTVIACENSHNSGSGILTTLPSKYSIVGNGINTIDIHSSVIASNGLPLANIPINLGIDRSFYTLDEHYEKQVVTPSGVYEIFQIGQPYTILEFDDEYIYEYLFDNNDAILGCEPITAKKYQTQSHGYFLCSGYYNNMPMIINNTTLLVYEQDELQMSSGCYISSSGVIFTDTYGSATAKYITPLNQRRVFDICITTNALECELVKTDIVLEPSVSQAVTTVNDTLIPDIRCVQNYYMNNTYVENKGFILTNKPLGGPMQVVFYNVDEWVANQLNQFDQNITPVGVGDILYQEDDILYVQTSFITHNNLIAVYYTLHRESFQLNRYGDL